MRPSITFVMSYVLALTALSKLANAETQTLQEMVMT